jgi:23S rRNA (uridine2552-2'-O)-methyltransferase
MRKHVKDEWVRAANERGYRSRAAWKLCQIDDELKILNRSARTVLDLGAAPGSWTQVLVERLSSPRFIVTVDLDEMVPLPAPMLRSQQQRGGSNADAIAYVQGDMNAAATRRRIGDALRDWRNGNAKGFDVIVSDMVPPISGDHTADHARSVSLCRAIVDFLQLEHRRGQGDGGGGRSPSLTEEEKEEEEEKEGDRTLRTPMLTKGGSLTMKVLQGGELAALVDDVRDQFGEVKLFKPKASRPASREIYLVAKKAR